MKLTNAELRQFISQSFNDDELDTFCFDYFPEVRQEFTRGMHFSQKVKLLISYCRRRGLMANLLTNLRQERPQPFAAAFAAGVGSAPEVASRPRNPRQVFVSHAHEDAALAQRLAGDLEAAGYPVWIAPDSIRPGEKWVSAINRGLDESGIFLVLLTPEAVASRWVRSETNVAVELEHEGKMRFVPLQIRPCRVPGLWRAYQWIPFRAGYEAGVAALLTLLKQDGEEGLEAEFARAWDVALKRVKPKPTETAEETKDDTGQEKETDRFIHEKTGLEFVRVPAGKFLYGDNREEKHLPEFWISKTPVTNAAYFGWWCAGRHLKRGADLCPAWAR